MPSDDVSNAGAQHASAFFIFELVLDKTCFCRASFAPTTGFQETGAS
ncbi:hypothetical protein TRICHSKD4_4744 [Roseibium sp. TrichSKD4]|nr:hypothetical protein TRICHSKD4_4744 [Roseibium sp. TrichSKD4]